MLSKFFKKTPKTELFVDVVATDENSNNNVIAVKIGDKGAISVPLLDLPENIYRCNAYKITIEPIEHTFAKPCEAWRKAYKPKIINADEHKERMKKMFGIAEEDDSIQL